MKGFQRSGRVPLLFPGSRIKSESPICACAFLDQSGREASPDLQTSQPACLQPVPGLHHSSVRTLNKKRHKWLVSFLQFIFYYRCTLWKTSPESWIVSANIWMPWNEPMLNGDIIPIILLFGWNIIVIILYIYIIRFMGICSHHWYMSVSTILNMWHKYEVQLRRLVDKRRCNG